MTTAVQVAYRRGTPSQIAAFTGVQGEMVVDTTNNRVVVQDGSTVGGFPAAKLNDGAVAFTGGTADGVTLGATTPAPASVTAPAAGDCSSRAVSSAWFGQNLSGGNLNKFRNGTMDVWQRGTSALTATTSGAYTADGWIVLPAGAGVTAAQAGGRLLTKNSLQVTGASSVTDVVIKQRIESLVAAAFCSQTVTVQAQVFNNTGGSITPALTVKRPTAQDNYTSTATDVNAVSLPACANNAWTRVAYTFAANANCFNGLEVAFDFGNNFSSSGKSLQIAECDIRVTPGVATGLNANPPPPELRPVAMEALFCQRYFYQIPAALNSPYALGVYQSGTDFRAPYTLPAIMRAAPALAFSAASTFQIYPAIVTPSAISTIGTITTQSFIMDATTSGGTAGNAGYLKDGGSGNSSVQASAEL